MKQDDKAAPEAEVKSLVPSDMTTVYIVFLRRGPTWSPEETEESERLQVKHLAHFKKLKEAGHLIMVGPCLDNGDLRGICVYRVNSLEEAKALAEADPAVQARRLAVEIHPWWVSESNLPHRIEEVK